MPQPLTIPEGTGVDWGALSSMIGIMDRLRERDEEDKVEAIRYQGQQDYSQLVAGGADPMDAMLKAAPKLFHRNPAGLAHVVEAKQRQEVAKQRAKFLNTPEEVMTYGGEQFVRRPSSSGDFNLTHIPRPPRQAKASISLGDRTFLMDEFRRTSAQLKELEIMSPKIMSPEKVSQKVQLSRKLLTLKNQLNALQGPGEDDEEYPVGDGAKSPPSAPASTNRIRIIKSTQSTQK